MNLNGSNTCISYCLCIYIRINICFHNTNVYFVFKHINCSL